MFKKPVIGIDIGKHSVKISSHKGEQKYKASDFEAMTKGELAKAALETYMKEYKIKDSALSISLPFNDEKMTHNVFTVPVMPEKDLQKSMPYEIQGQTYLEDMESVYYRWEIIGGTEEHYKVLAITVDKELIDKKYELYKLQKWEIASIEINPVSLGRVVSHEPVVIIDFGHNETRVTALRSGVIEYVGSVGPGGEQLTQDIAEEFRIFFHEAENLKHEKGMILKNNHMSDEKDRVAAAIMDSIEDMSKKIKDTIMFIENIDGFEDGFVIYYTGAASRLPYLIDFVSENIGNKIQPLVAEDSENPDYAISAGASLQKQITYLKNINFAASVAVKPHYFWHIVTAAAIVLIALQAMLVHFNQETAIRVNEAEKAVKESQQEINHLEEEIGDEEQVAERYHDAKQLLEQLSKREAITTYIMFELEHLVPKDVSIGEIEIEKENLKVKGHANKYSDIGFFAIKLENLGKTEIKDVNEDMSFTVTTNVKN